jgi:hypothetical protein
VYQIARTTDRTRDERLQQHFQNHRQSFLEAYFPDGSLINTLGDPVLENWSSCHQVVRDLRELLPFGRHIELWEYETFTESVLPHIVTASRRQLLYWHLSQATSHLNEPIERLVLTEDPHLLWDDIIPPLSGEIRNELHRGNRVRYLTQFSLSHQHISVTYKEICIATNPVGDAHFHVIEELVIANGIELTYDWDQRFWETTYRNQDPNLINPDQYHRPTSAPLPRVVIEQARAALIDRITSPEPGRLSPLPPSSPSSSEWRSWDPGPVTPWDTVSAQCYCQKEVCSCGFRPDTPPTPPGVNLWTPGSITLPYRE